MELIHAWVNNPNVEPRTIINWPKIRASPINEYVIEGLLDMAFPTLFPNGDCDWIGARNRNVYLHEFTK